MHSKKNMPIREKAQQPSRHSRMGEVCETSEVLTRTKFTHNVGWVAVLAVDGFIHGAHIVCGDSSGQGVESGLNLRPALQRFSAHQGNGLVRREVVPIVLKNGETECLNRSVSRIGGDHVDLVRIEGAVEQAEVHGAWRAGKSKAIRVA